MSVIPAALVRVLFGPAEPSRYVLEKEQLYVEVMDKCLDLVHKRQVIVKEEEKKRISRMCHDGIDEMHFGRDKIYGKVNL